MTLATDTSRNKYLSLLNDKIVTFSKEKWVVGEATTSLYTLTLG